MSPTKDECEVVDRVKTLEQIITGGAIPKEGLVLKVDRVENTLTDIMWWVKAIGGAVIVQVVIGFCLLMILLARLYLTQPGEHADLFKPTLPIATGG